MPDFDRWRWSGAARASTYNGDPRMIIERDKESIVFTRSTGSLTTQDVRVVPANTGSGSNQAGAALNQGVEFDYVVLGYDDLNIQPDDTFIYPTGGDRYKIRFVDESIPNLVQAFASQVQ